MNIEIEQRFEDEVKRIQRNKVDVKHDNAGKENNEINVTFHFNSSKDACDAKNLVEQYCIENGFKIKHRCCSEKGFYLAKVILEPVQERIPC